MSRHIILYGIIVFVLLLIVIGSIIYFYNYQNYLDNQFTDSMECGIIAYHVNGTVVNYSDLYFRNLNVTNISYSSAYDSLNHSYYTKSYANGNVLIRDYFLRSGSTGTFNIEFNVTEPQALFLPYKIDSYIPLTVIFNGKGFTNYESTTPNNWAINDPAVHFNMNTSNFSSSYLNYIFKRTITITSENYSNGTYLIGIGAPSCSGQGAVLGFLTVGSETLNSTNALHARLNSTNI